MSEPWRITLFGGLRAQHREQIITRFKTQKVASLFAYLAYYLRQAHSREILIELLWPDSNAPTLRNSLSVALSSLRNQFEPPGVPQGTVIRADRFSVGLNHATVTTDVARFEQAIKEASKAGSAIERAQHLASAVELYQGPLLPGFYEDWIFPEQARLSGLFVDAVGALVSHVESLGDIRAALSHARHAVAVDPLREEGQQHLIRLLAADGQPGAALRQYKEYECLLEEEIGEEPSAALRALFRQIEKGSGLSAPPATPPLAPHQPVPPTPAAQPATMTFLMTDIEGSTRLFQQAPEAYSAARERHHALLRQIFARQGGQEVQETGDGFVIAFPTAGSALACAIASQKALAGETWPEESGPLKVRMALHTGDVQPGSEEGQYRGIVLHHASRMLTAAHGGQILVSDATASLAAGGGDEGVRLVDLGVYRLRDVPEARRLFQAEYSHIAQTDFGPLAAEAGHKANVPPRFTRFFGREGEIARLREMLISSQVRLVTVTGPAGTGKTRVSLEVAERLVEPFAGAVYFVALADLNDPALIAGAILDSLGVPRSPQQEPLEQAVEALAKKPTLLVLDNFEHLVVGGADVVQTLLTRISSLKLLVTSRQLLDLSAEREFVLSPLPVPGTEESPEQLSLYDSVQLFLDRAQQVMPYFQVNNANAAAVAGLVGGLEGIPLAIELAAARVQVLTPTQMLSQLSHRLDFLARRKRDVAERQRTLRGALEWSYRLLAPELQRFFSRLSVFRGGWSVEAAEQVCEEPLALDYLEQLRECSLVLSETVMEGGAYRFRMLETLREYGQERLAENKEADALRARHLVYFLSLAEGAEAHLKSAEQAEWLNRLETEYDNLREAVRFSNEQRLISNEETGSELMAPGKAGLRLAVAMWRFWDVRGWLDEGRQILASVLAYPQRDGDIAARAKALNGAGILATKKGDDQAARQLCEESLKLFRELNDPHGIAAALGSLGMIASHQGDKETAQALYQESLELQRALGSQEGMAVALVNLGLIAFNRGDYAAARACYEESQQLFRELNDPRGISYALHGLGQVAYFEGNITLARTFFEESLALRRELGNRESAAATLHNLGLLAGEQQDYAAAYSFFMESLAIKRSLGNRRSIALTLNDLALLSVKQEDFAAARRFLQEALALRQELTDQLGLAECLQAAGEMKAAQGEAQQAVRLFGAAENLCRSLGASLPPDEQTHYENILQVARAALGEEVFASAWEEGQAMGWEEAVALALK
jgi:predicted ATPase/DNA-binding SARP family transcriptional activator/class 3 adenylate cyclase/Tfp pilus assembly protein PilF